jgi:hypothetical protein
MRKRQLAASSSPSEDFVGKCSLMHRARPVPTALEACCGLLQGWYISETSGKTSVHSPSIQKWYIERSGT